MTARAYDRGPIRAELGLPGLPPLPSGRLPRFVEPILPDPRPVIRHREKSPAFDAFDISAPDLRSAVDRLVRCVADHDAALRAKIAILYPPLPDGYAWTREELVDGFCATYRIRYVARHVDEIAPGSVVFRP